jgi:hypothetical protein
MSESTPEAGAASTPNITCANCNAEIIIANSKFCYECGVPLMKKCLLCQALLPSHVQSCLLCSAPQDPEMLKDLPTKHCGGCNALLLMTHDKCYYCNSDVQEGGSQGSVPYTVEVVEESQEHPNDPSQSALADPQSSVVLPSDQETSIGIKRKSVDGNGDDSSNKRIKIDVIHGSVQDLSSDETNAKTTVEVDGVHPKDADDFNNKTDNVIGKRQGSPTNINDYLPLEKELHRDTSKSVATNESTPEYRQEAYDSTTEHVTISSTTKEDEPFIGPEDSDSDSEAPILLPPAKNNDAPSRLNRKNENEVMVENVSQIFPVMNVTETEGLTVEFKAILPWKAWDWDSSNSCVCLRFGHEQLGQWNHDICNGEIVKYYINK